MKDFQKAFIDTSGRYNCLSVFDLFIKEVKMRLQDGKIEVGTKVFPNSFYAGADTMFGEAYFIAQDRINALENQIEYLKKEIAENNKASRG